MMPGKRAFFPLWLLLIFFLWTLLVAQDTLFVPVTFYDFRSNESNPEFEQPHLGGRKYGMVADLLDADRKPQLGPTPYMNYYIDYWFRNWSGPGGGQGDNTIPIYTRTSGGEYDAQIRYDGNSTVNYDTAFKNIVIPDSLPFMPVPGRPGEYRFSRTGGGEGEFFWIDNRGFGNEGRSHNFSFTMELHWQFTYETGQFFEFQGDDDVWVFINGQLVLDIGGIHGAIFDDFVLDAALAASLGLEEGGVYWLDFFYAERHTSNSTIRITTNIITSEPAVLTLSVQDTTMQAGDTLDILAQVFDQHDSLRMDLYDNISWRIVPASQRPGDAIVGEFTSAADSAQVARFTATEAFHTAIIEARLVDPQDPSNILVEYANVNIIAGPPTNVWIEQESEAELSEGALLAIVGPTSVDPNPLSLIVFDETQTQRYAYAVTRDQYGNYVDLARGASWLSGNGAVFLVAGTAGKQFEGFITRVSSGVAELEASQGALVPDTVSINIYDAVITELRLVDALTGEVLTGININTDQEQRIKVQGIWSDNPGVWVDVTGFWNLDPATLLSAIEVPTGLAGSWTYSPINPGQGSLTVTSVNNIVVSIPVNITPAPPSRMEIDLITPPNERIAGQPIQIEVRIYNTDGLVPGGWSGSNAFNDLLDNSPNPNNPYVTVEGATGALGQGMDETFVNGIDTMSVTLFYAPYYWEDSLHQITALLSASIPAQTDPFRLLPGPLDRLQLEDQNDLPLPDQVTLHYPDEGLTIKAAGYDAYGNRIGPISSYWLQSGTLHDPGDNAETQIYYSTESVTGNESGRLTAMAEQDQSISDWIDIVIIGPSAMLDTAYTRDLDGDGYLDAIELHFNKSLTLPPDLTVNDIFISYWSSTTQVIFEPVSINPAPGSNSDTFIIYLNENRTAVPGMPQTGWTPTITINNLDSAEVIQDEPTTDGAGPVIWKVEKMVNSAGDRTLDKVIVTFSEEVVGADGSLLSPSLAPATLFNVWTRDASGAFVPADVILHDITYFEGGTEPTRATFYMSNGENLTSEYYFSIDAGQNLMTDKPRGGTPPNSPHEDNIKVQVVVKGLLGPIEVGPNPITPVMRYFEEVLTAQDPVLAFNRAKYEGGAVMIANILLPSDPNNPSIVDPNYAMKALLMVFDAVGNLTYSRENPENIIPLEQYTSGTAGGIWQLVLYWNGITDRHKKAAPGLYRAVLYIEDSNGIQQKFTGNVGVAK